MHSALWYHKMIREREEAASYTEEALFFLAHIENLTVANDGKRKCREKDTTV